MVTLSPCVAQNRSRTTVKRTKIAVPSSRPKVQTKRSVTQPVENRQSLVDALQITKDGILGVKMSDKVYSIRTRKMKEAVSPDDYIGREGPQWEEDIEFKLPSYRFTHEDEVEVKTGTTKARLVDYNDNTEKWFWNDYDHLAYLWADIHVVEVENSSPRKKEMLQCVCERLNELCVSKEMVNDTNYKFRMDNGLRFEVYNQSKH